MTIESLLLTKNDLLQDIDCVIMIPQSYGAAERKESLKHDARFYFLRKRRVIMNATILQRCCKEAFIALQTTIIFKRMSAI